MASKQSKNGLESHKTFLTDEETYMEWHPNYSYEGIDLESTETAHREACDQKYSQYAQSKGAILNDKQWLCVKIRTTKLRVVDSIFSSKIGIDHVALVNPNTGQVGVYNCYLYKHYPEDDKIYLEELQTKAFEKPEVRVIYDGGPLRAEKGEWLRPVDGLISESPEGQVSVKNKGKFDSVYTVNFKPYHILVAMFYGDEILSVVGPPETHDVNHRNRNHYDNRLVNLEVVTKDDNREHKTVTDKYLFRKYNNFGCGN